MTNEAKTSEDRSGRPLSPCILICTLDENKECLGCGRSLAEVSGWSLMSVAEQWAVIDKLAARDRRNDDTIAPLEGVE